MKVASFPENEKERLAALLRYKVLNTDFEECYNELTQLASEICQTPIALISLIDSDRQWFKAKTGLAARETPRDWAFCAHAVLQDEMLVVDDTLLDERFFDNPLVTNDPSIRFYAGAQIKTHDGFVLGTVCAIDRVPRHLSDYQLNALKVLAKQVMSQLELRLAFEDLQKHTQKLHELNATKDKLFSVIAHDLRAPIGGIFGLSEMLLEDLEVQPKEACTSLAQEIHDTSQQTLSLLDNLLRWSLLERGQFDYQPMAIPLLAIVQKNLRLLSSVALKKQIQLHVDCPSYIFVMGDKNMLSSVFQNLLSNAIKFTASQGHIYISAKALQHNVIVTIKDTGVGMTHEQIDQLFVIEKNVSTHGTVGEAGTGLGLVLCKQFLALHQSDLCVQSEVGVGTQFSFALTAVVR